MNLIKRSIRYVLEVFLSRFGYRLEPKNFLIPHLVDKEFMTIFSKQKSFGWEEGGPKIEKLFLLKDLLISIRKIEGDLAECGTFKGSSALIIAEYMIKYHDFEGRQFHIFDSFEGLDNPTNDDGNTDMLKGDFLGSFEEVKENLKKYTSIDFHKGWIPKKFHEVENIKFSFVHIDLDFYNPIRESINFFADRLSVGGVMLFDDYGQLTTSGAKKAVDEFFNQNKDYFSLQTFSKGQAILKRIK
jgi:O-methyltransferase